MYRPLVQPKFGTSRGQILGKGLNLLTTGGPKHRGRLLTANPNLREFASGWITGCTSTVKSESIRIENLTTADCFVARQSTVLIPYVVGQRYRIRAVISDAINVALGPYVLLGNEGVPLPLVESPGVYDFIATKTTDPGGIQSFQFNLNNQSDVTFELNFLGLYEINP